MPTASQAERAGALGSVARLPAPALRTRPRVDLRNVLARGSEGYPEVPGISMIGDATYEDIR
jgi:hypothetical protein